MKVEKKKSNGTCKLAFKCVRVVPFCGAHLETYREFFFTPRLALSPISRDDSVLDERGRQRSYIATDVDARGNLFEL